MKLTQSSITTLTLPPGKADAVVFDSEIPGFGLRLRESGASSWILQYRVGTKQRRLSLGTTSAVGAQEARKQASKLYAAIKLGQDPAQEKIANRTLALETLGAVMPAYLAEQQKRLRPRSLAEVRRHLLVHLKPLHGLPLAAVERRTVAARLTTIAETHSGPTANRVRSSLAAFFAWAISEGYVDDSPVAWIKRREEQPRDRVLTDDELREIWTALRDDAYGRIVKLLILTGARREEIGALRWSEVDLEAGTIELAPERTKNGRAHTIVLSEAACEVLRSQPRLTWPDGAPCDLVFGRGVRGFADWPGSKTDLDRRILAARSKGAAAMEDWVLHDFRRLLSTTLNDQGIAPPHIVETILGHAGGHKAGSAGVYNKALYVEERRRALERWAAFVEEVVSGKRPTATITKLRRRN
jgi:integrase